MKIIICTRDLTFGVGQYIVELLKEFESNKEIEKILIIGPEKLRGFSPKIQFDLLKLKGNFFITKEPAFALKCENKIKKALKKEKYDLIYTCFPFLIFKKFNIPFIAIFHGLHKLVTQTQINDKKFKIAKIFHSLYSFFDYKTIQNADKVIFVSKKTLSEAEKFYSKYKDKFIHISSFVDTSEFYSFNQVEKEKLKRKYNLQKNKKYILFAGRLEPLKGIDLLIKMVKELTKDIEVELLITGKGFLSNQLKFYNFIKYLGETSHDDMNEIYNIADLFILPSYYENCPLTVLEAMASGCLILASDVGDIKDMVGNDKLVFDLRNCNQFKNKIFELLNLSKKEKNKIIRVLIKRAKEKYSTKIISKKILDLYKNVEEE